MKTVKEEMDRVVDCIINEPAITLKIEKKGRPREEMKQIKQNNDHIYFK